MLLKPGVTQQLEGTTGTRQQLTETSGRKHREPHAALEQHTDYPAKRRQATRTHAYSPRNQYNPPEGLSRGPTASIDRRERCIQNQGKPNCINSGGTNIEINYTKKRHIKMGKPQHKGQQNKIIALKQMLVQPKYSQQKTKDNGVFSTTVQIQRKIRQ